MSCAIPKERACAPFSTLGDQSHRTAKAVAWITVQSSRDLTWAKFDVSVLRSERVRRRSAFVQVGLWQGFRGMTPFLSCDRLPRNPLVTTCAIAQKRLSLPEIFTSGKSPAGTVLPSYKLRSLRTIFRNHLRSVPLNLLTRAQ